jgi:hypothetical protein
MRAFRGTAVAIAAGTILSMATTAGADGGAYIDMDRTHYLPGETAVGIGYVSIPEPRQDLLERGPFWVYVVPPNAWIREGRPLPDSVIRVGAATIGQAKGTTFRVRVSFTVPDVPGDNYTLQMCNEPCTISGFREPLSATVSIVQTEREAQLLNERDRLARQTWSLQRRARKAEKANAALQTQLDASRQDVLELSVEVSRLARELDAASATAATSQDDRPLVDAWALFGLGIAVIGAVLAFALAMLFARRSSVPGLVVPDTIEELERGEAATATR